jgi:hypothetical protein
MEVTPTIHVQETVVLKQAKASTKVEFDPRVYQRYLGVGLHRYGGMMLLAFDDL